MLEKTISEIEEELVKDSHMKARPSYAVINNGPGGVISEIYQFAIKQFLHAGHGLFFIFYDVDEEDGQREHGRITTVSCPNYVTRSFPFDINNYRISGDMFSVCIACGNHDFKAGVELGEDISRLGIAGVIWFNNGSFIVDDRWKKIPNTAMGTDIINTTTNDMDKLHCVIDYIKNRKKYRDDKDPNAIDVCNLLIITSAQYENPEFIEACMMYCVAGLIQEIAVINDDFVDHYPDFKVPGMIHKNNVGLRCIHRLDINTGKILVDRLLEFLDDKTGLLMFRISKGYNSSGALVYSDNLPYSQTNVYLTDMNENLFNFIVWGHFNQSISAYTSDTIHRILEGDAKDIKEEGEKSC